MTVRQWKVFRAVVEQGSITKAAHSLFMTQPAVSHVVSELEKELGYTLLDRVSHRFTVNSRGWQLYYKIVQVLESIEDLERSTARIEHQALLRIGSSMTIANACLPQMIRQFQASCPETPLAVEVESAARIRERLKLNQIDLGFIEGPADPREFNIYPFSSYRLNIVAAPSFAVEAVIAPERIPTFPWLLREAGSAVRDPFDSALNLLQQQVEPFWTSVNTQALIQAALAGLGLAVVPELAALPFLQQGQLKEVQIQGLSFTNQNQLILHPDKFVSAPIRQWLILVQRWKEENHAGRF